MPRRPKKPGSAPGRRQHPPPDPATTLWQIEYVAHGDPALRDALIILIRLGRRRQERLSKTEGSHGHPAPEVPPAAPTDRQP